MKVLCGETPRIPVCLPAKTRGPSFVSKQARTLLWSQPAHSRDPGGKKKGGRAVSLSLSLEICGCGRGEPASVHESATARCSRLRCYERVGLISLLFPLEISLKGTPLSRKYPREGALLCSNRKAKRTASLYGPVLFRERRQLFVGRSESSPQCVRVSRLLEDVALSSRRVCGTGTGVCGTVFCGTGTGGDAHACTGKSTGGDRGRAVRVAAALAAAGAA